MMKEHPIRSAISSDIRALVALEHDYSTDHVWQMSYSAGSGETAAAFREVRLPRPMRVTYPREAGSLLDDWLSRACVLVAESEAAPCGYLTMLEGPAPGAGWIMDLVVGARHRRQGIATRLLQAGRAWASEKGLGRLFLEMQSKNYPAICLARKLGFSFAGYSDRYYPDQDIAIFFSLDLA
jgi:ribosomal protein S18 acetylase RimI-like enzyme